VRAADFPLYSVAKGAIVGGFDWEGFYVGGHIGSATDHVSFAQTNVSWFDLPSGFPSTTSVDTGEAGSLGATSVTGGLQMGYNWMIPGPFLVGIEADISGAGLSSTTLTSPPGDPAAVASWTDKLDVYGSLRARLGWVGNNWLFYGTGGFGWAYDKFTRKQLTAPLDPINPPFVDTNALQANTVRISGRVGSPVPASNGGLPAPGRSSLNICILTPPRRPSAAAISASWVQRRITRRPRR
jgi:Outer membrane protein beta-barrel domain